TVSRESARDHRTSADTPAAPAESGTLAATRAGRARVSGDQDPVGLHKSALPRTPQESRPGVCDVCVSQSLSGPAAARAPRGDAVSHLTRIPTMEPTSTPHPLPERRDRAVHRRPVVALYA